MKWDAIVADERYTSLAPEKQKVVQDRYFDSYVKTDPRFKPEIETTLKAKLFGEKETSVFDTAISAGKNLLKGAASFFIQTPQIAGSLIKEQGETLGEKPDYMRLTRPEPIDIAFGPSMKIADLITTKVKSEITDRTTIDENITKAGQSLIDANRRYVFRHRIEPDKGPLSQVMFDVGSAGSSVLTSLGLSYLTKSPAAIAPLFGLIQKGQIYQEAREAGKAPKEASRISTAAGIPEAALEYVGLNIFINKLRGLKSLPRIALRAGEQALQEGSQQFSEETIAKVSNLRNTTWPDIIKKSAYSAAIGLITGLPAATVATYGENKGILGDFRKAGFTDDEAMPIIEKLIEKQQENIKPEIINTLNEEVKKTDDFVLKPEDQMTIRQELEKYIQIPKDVKTDEIKAGVGEAIPEPVSAEKAPVIEDLKGETGKIDRDIVDLKTLISKVSNGKLGYAGEALGFGKTGDVSLDYKTRQALKEIGGILEIRPELESQIPDHVKKLVGINSGKVSATEKEINDLLSTPKEGGGETSKEIGITEKDLPDYAQRSIRQVSRERMTNQGLITDPFKDTQWEKIIVPIESLRKNNEVVFNGKMIARGSKTEGPILLDSNNEVIDGNNRLREAINKGDTTIDVYRPKLSTPKGEGKVDKVAKPTQISPAMPATQITDKKILSLISNLNGISQKEYGKPFSELKTAEKKNIFTRSDKFGVIESPMSEEEALNISATKITSTDWDKSRAPFASYKFPASTDGRYLITDKNIVKQIKDEYWEKQQKKIAKEMVSKKGFSTIQAEEFAKTEVRRQQNEDHQFPNTKTIIDNASKNNITIDFIGLRSADGYAIGIYSDGKQYYPLSMDYVKLMKKYFPNAVMKADKNNTKPISFVENGELKGVLMPMSIAFTGETSLPVKQPPQPSTPSGTAFASIYHNDIPIEQGTQYYQARSFEIPELIRLVREVMGKYPNVVKATGKAAGRFYGAFGNSRIKIVAELFKQGNEKELGIVIAHEFGHLTDYMPEGTLKRGNIIGRLLTLQGYLKNTFGELNNKEIKAELLAVTQYMHPFDEKTVPPSYKSYRMSSKELYAEAISLLLNSPGTMEKMAPKFTKAFFENIDKKLEVKQAYFDLLELLNGERADILGALDSDIRRMFAKADPLRTQKLAEKKVAGISTFDKIRQHLDNKYHPLIKKIQNLEKEGKFIPTENNPKYLLEEYTMSNNAVYDWLLTMDKEVKNVMTSSDIDQIDFGKFLFLKRIIGNPATLGEEVDGFDDIDKDSLGEMIDASTGKPFKEEFTDRQNIANPLGIQPKRAQEQLDYLKIQIGEEKFAKLEQIAQKFHDLVFSVVTEAVKVGSYNAKVFAERILPNKDTYVSFGVINYMQNFVSAGVKKQIGTLNEIENPFITTIMKTISLIKLNEKQRAMNSVRNLLRTYFPTDIEVSKKHKTTGGGVDWTETPGSFKLLEDGRMVSYEVDPYIARSLKYDPNAGEIGQLLNTILGNKIFKDIVITYNPGFALAFNPIRDFKRTYKSLNAMGQRVSLLKLLTEYVKAMPLSYKRLRGIDDNVIREMIQNRSLDIPFSDFHAADYEDSNSAYNELLKRYQLSKDPNELKGIRKAILKPAIQVLEFLRFHGSALESVSKIAGYNILKSRDVPPMERAFKTRTYIGTPNFRTKGLSTEITNAVFIFSNIMKEGLKADTSLATNPKTRAGYWWSTAKIDLFPKLLMVLAAAGLFGDPLKKFFEKASEYDKTNYIIIPVGEINGKSVYIRIPHDESGRLISAILWKLTQVMQGKPEQLQQIFAFGAGQMPQVTPMIGIGSGWIQYLSGNNPYRPFKGDNVLTDTEYKAGGGAALKKMVEWSAGEFGLTQFATYNKDSNSTFETIVQLTPVLNRLIKVSDAGVSQDLRQIRKDVEREQAQMTLLKREEFKDGAKRIEKGENAIYVLREIKNKVYGRGPIDNQKAGNLLKGLAREILKQKQDDPYVDALIYAGSNSEKKQILDKMRGSIGKEKFKDRVKLLYKFRVVTDETMPMEEWRRLLK
jgi:hypothetical protein